MTDQDYRELLKKITTIQIDVECIKTKISIYTSIWVLITGIVSSAISGIIIIFFK